MFHRCINKVIESDFPFGDSDNGFGMFQPAYALNPVGIAPHGSLRNVTDTCENIELDVVLCAVRDNIHVIDGIKKETTCQQKVSLMKPKEKIERIMSDRSPPWPQAEVARQMGVCKATVFRILRDEGYEPRLGVITKLDALYNRLYPTENQIKEVVKEMPENTLAMRILKIENDIDKLLSRIMVLEKKVGGVEAARLTIA